MSILLLGAGLGVDGGGAPSTTGDPVQQARQNTASATEMAFPGTAAEIAAGSAVIMVLQTKNTGNVTDGVAAVTNVGSWTVAPSAINNSNFATNRYLTIAYTRTTGVVPAGTVFTVENSGSALMAGIIYSVANVHADILAAAIGTFASAGSGTSPASVITPATVNDTVMAFFAVVDGTEANVAADVSYSGAYEKEMTGGPVEGVVVGAWKKPNSTSAQTHTGTITSNPWGARSLVLKPA